MFLGITLTGWVFYVFSSTLAALLTERKPEWVFWTAWAICAIASALGSAVQHQQYHKRVEAMSVDNVSYKEKTDA